MSESHGVQENAIRLVLDATSHRDIILSNYPFDLIREDSPDPGRVVLHPIFYRFTPKDVSELFSNPSVSNRSILFLIIDQGWYWMIERNQLNSDISIGIIRALKNNPRPLPIVQAILENVKMISKNRGFWMLLGVIKTGHSLVLRWMFQDNRFHLDSHLGKGLLVAIKTKQYHIAKIISQQIHLRFSNDSNLLRLVSITNHYLTSV